MSEPRFTSDEFEVAMTFFTNGHTHGRIVASRLCVPLDLPLYAEIGKGSCCSARDLAKLLNDRQSEFSETELDLVKALIAEDSL